MIILCTAYSIVTIGSHREMVRKFQSFSVKYILIFHMVPGRHLLHHFLKYAQSVCVCVCNLSGVHMYVNNVFTKNY